MSGTALGLLSGLALGLAAAFGGFTAFLLVLVFAAIGLTVGRVADGKLDITQLLGRERD
jgi:uncharacterized membrane protein